MSDFEQTGEITQYKPGTLSLKLDSGEEYFVSEWSLRPLFDGDGTAIQPVYKEDVGSAMLSKSGKGINFRIGQQFFTCSKEKVKELVGTGGRVPLMSSQQQISHKPVVKTEQDQMTLVV
jgi:hypothetical protein